MSCKVNEITHSGNIKLNKCVIKGTIIAQSIVIEDCILENVNLVAPDIKVICSKLNDVHATGEFNIIKSTCNIISAMHTMIIEGCIINSMTRETCTFITYNNCSFHSVEKKRGTNYLYTSCKFDNENLNGLNMQECCLIECTMTQCVIGYSDVFRGVMHSCSVSNTKLNGIITLYDTMLMMCHAEGAIFRGNSNSSYGCIFNYLTCKDESNMFGYLNPNRRQPDHQPAMYALGILAISATFVFIKHLVT